MFYPELSSISPGVFAFILQKTAKLSILMIEGYFAEFRFVDNLFKIIGFSIERTSLVKNNFCFCPEDGTTVQKASRPMGKV